MKKKIFRMLLDCDGVLADFTGGAVKLYNTITGRKMDPSSIRVWNFTGALEFETPAQKILFDRALRAPGFAMSLEPLPGSTEGVQALRQKVDLHIVTSPLSGSATWAYERSTWLEMHYAIDHHRVHHSDMKWVFSGDLFVDDKPQNVREWQDNNLHGTSFLWDTPGNRDETELERISSWDELLERINGRRTS
jgi:5'(3')-deoxyribonucleotidase